MVTGQGDQLALFGPSTLRHDLAPGSEEAKRLGCRCSVIANDEGKGIIYPDEQFDHTVWAVSTRCRLHWQG